MKKNNSDISFISKVPGLETIEECIPKPISNFVPSWWKDMPVEKNTLSVRGVSAGNAKLCPSFADYFSTGYIMPMWVDTVLQCDSETGEWFWQTPTDQFKWDIHTSKQYLDTVDHTYFGKKSYFVFKTECPWMVFSKEPYMMYQLPTYFHFNEDFSVVPGVRDIGSYNVMNIQFLIHSNKKEIIIKRGTPIAHFIPFKKEKIDIDVRGATEKDFKNIEKFNMDIQTKFFHTKIYKRERKSK